MILIYVIIYKSETTRYYCLDKLIAYVIKGDNTMITGVEALRIIQTICITESKS